MAAIVILDFTFSEIKKINVDKGKIGKKQTGHCNQS